MSDEVVYRTAPSTPGQLNMTYKLGLYQNSQDNENYMVQETFMELIDTFLLLQK